MDEAYIRIGVIGSMVRIGIKAFREPITIPCQNKQQAQRACIELASLMQHLREKLERERGLRYWVSLRFWRLWKGKPATKLEIEEGKRLGASGLKLVRKLPEHDGYGGSVVSMLPPARGIH